jgi:hypothetical protein
VGVWGDVTRSRQEEDEGFVAENEQKGQSKISSLNVYAIAQISESLGIRRSLTM